MQKYLFVLSILFTLLSCSKMEEVNVADDYLIIGLTYGECLGNCSHFFKLENEQLFADTEDEWWNGAEDIPFETTALDNIDALSEFKTIADSFPSFLIETDEAIFGCPDCGDWGALHVIKIENGEERIWTLDNQIVSNPEEIQDWTKDIQTLIYSLIN